MSATATATTTTLTPAPALVILNYSSNFRPNWFGPFSLLSALLFIHFSVSIGIWLTWFIGLARNPYMRGELLPAIAASFTYFTPALILLVASAWTCYLAVRRRRAAWRVGLILLASAAFLCIDVKFYRYQVSIDVAPREYWESGGRAREYFTWWWLNDRWPRNQSISRY